MYWNLFHMIETDDKVRYLYFNREADIFGQREEFEEYFSSLIALSAHFIGLNASSSE